MSFAPVPTRFVPFAAAAVLVAGLVPLGALGAAAATPLVLRDANGVAVYSGDAAAYPSFSTASFADGCPAGAQNGARLSVSDGSSQVVVSATVPVTGGSAVSVPMGASFSSVVPANTTAATLTLECLALSNGVPSSIVPAASLTVTLSAAGWSVPGQPTTAPTVTPTSAAPSPSAPASNTPDPTPTAAASPQVSTSATPVPTAGRGSDLATTGGQIAGVAGLGALLAVAAGLAIRWRARRRTAAQD